MLALGLVVALAAAQLPTPAKLLQARQVLLVGEGIDRASLEELARRISSWGRWTLTPDDATADVIVVLSQRPDTQGAAQPGESVWLLTIKAKEGSLPLYSDAQRAGPSVVVSIGDLVDRLRGTVGIGPPSSTEPAGGPTDARTSPAAPSAPTEPCRVFVTEEMVNPSFFTVVKTITYAKKYYGGSSHAWEGMAREGWKVDADAVVAVNINFRPSMFSWASPHARGTAVRWTDEGRKHFSSLVGQCFPRQ